MSAIGIYAVTTLCLSYLSLFALNLSMERNAKLVFKFPLSSKLMMLSKVLGWGGLILALFSSILAWGVAIGITAWFGVITVVVGLIVFIQSYQARLNLNLAAVVLLFVIGLQFFRLYE